MLNEAKKLIESDPNYEVLLKVILDSPYIERHSLMEKVGLPGEIFEKLLKTLEDKLIVLELASQAQHSTESRVPRKIYMVNPQMEQDIKTILHKA